jgi:hypothetical protein
MKYKKIIPLIIISIACCFGSFAQKNVITKKHAVIIYIDDTSSARINFGLQKLQKTLMEHGYSVAVDTKHRPHPGKKIISVEDGTRRLDSYFKDVGGDEDMRKKMAPKEGFIISSGNENNIFIAGHDATGTLYGCLELADRIRTTGTLPGKINIEDAPEMILRGQCIGLQKSTYLPGRGVYEYPYTPETFPWFYDKKLWLQVLDSMVENRMNSLYLWNGHPFASLVRLKDYPYAVEVDDATFKKNEEMYRFVKQKQTNAAFG